MPYCILIMVLLQWSFYLENGSIRMAMKERDIDVQCKKYKKNKWTKVVMKHGNANEDLFFVIKLGNCAIN